jgi:hypothetical protein
MFRAFYHLIWIILILLALLASPVFAEIKGGKVNIHELAATTSKTHLLLFGILENSLNDEMVEVLHSGIPLRFTFFTQLHKTDGNRPDELVAEGSFEHHMSYDTLKEVYQVTVEEKNNKLQSFSELSAALEVINEISGAKIVPLEQLIPDNTYRLSVRAKLYEKTLPLSLQSVLPFLSWGNIETGWHELEFTY